jgi:nucleoside-diphosphate-sugar epimerase
MTAGEKRANWNNSTGALAACDGEASDMLRGLCQSVSGRVLVTGATGVVGGRLAAILRAAGVRVTALVREGRTTDRLRALDVDVHWGDVADDASVRAAAAGCSYVVHCAAITRRSPDAPSREWETNALAPAMVWHAARDAGAQRMVHCSTVGVHGPLCAWPADENAPLHPNTPYRRTKLAGEKRLAEVARAGATDWVIARLTSVCGPGAYGSWKTLHCSVVDGRPWLIGAAAQPIHIIDVDDACQGLLRCLIEPAASWKTYLLAGPEAIPLRDFFRHFAAAEGRELKARRLPARPMAPLVRTLIRLTAMWGWMPGVLHSADFLVSARSYDISLARRELGYVPRYNTAASVARMLQDCGAGVSPARAAETDAPQVDIPRAKVSR